MIKLGLLSSLVIMLGAGVTGCGGPGGEGNPPGDADGADTISVGDDGVPTDTAGDAPMPSKGCEFIGGLQPGSPWAMPGRCPNHSGLSSVVAAQAFKKNWNSELPINGHLVITADGTLIGGTGTGLVAIAPGGKKKWEVPGLGSIYYATIGADGTTYGSSSDGKLHAVAADGKLRWSQPVGKDPGGVVIATDGTLFVGNAEGKLNALGPDGSSKWSKDVGGPVTTTPALTADGVLYVAAGKALVAISTSGAPRWSYPTTGDAKAHPLVLSDGTVIVGSNDGRLHAVTPTGTAKWTLPLSPPDTGELAVTNPVTGPDGAVYVGMSVLKGLNERRKMFAVKADGSESFSRVDQGVPGAVGRDGIVYLSGASGDAFALRPDGSQLWTGKVTLDALSRAAIGADGTVYFTSGAFAVGP